MHSLDSCLVEQQTSSGETPCCMAGMHRLAINTWAELKWGQGPQAPNTKLSMLHAATVMLPEMRVLALTWMPQQP